MPPAGTPRRSHPGTGGKCPLLAPLHPTRCPMSGSCSSAPLVARSCVLLPGASCWSPLEPPPSAVAQRGRRSSGQTQGRGGCCVFMLLTELWPPRSPVGTADPPQGVVRTKSRGLKHLQPQTLGAFHFGEARSYISGPPNAPSSPALAVYSSLQPPCMG